MREMKNSFVAWIGEIPSTWQLFRFKDNYKNLKEIAGEKSSEFERLALTLNGVIKRPKDDTDGLQPKEFDSYQILRDGEFVFKMIDLQNISTSRVGLSPYTGLVSPAYIKFAPKSDTTDSSFVYYFMMCLYFNHVFNHLGGDGVRSALNGTDLGLLPVPCPSIHEQERIASLLDDKCAQIDALIANEEKQIEKLEQYKQSIITETVTKGLNPDISMKDSGVEWIRCIPENWRIVPLKSLFSFGKGLPITKEDLIKEGIPVISYGQIHAKWNSGVTIHEELKRFVSKDYISTNPDSLVKQGDFIMADTSEDREGCGNCAYVDKEEQLFAGYHTIILSAKEGIDNKYLAYLFRTDAWRSQIRKCVSGVKLFSISRRILGDVSVVIPDKADEIVSFLDGTCERLLKLIAIKQIKIEELNRFKKSLIFEYVTGKKEAPQLA